MTTRSLAQFLQNFAGKNKSQIADCSGCIATSFGAADPDKESFLESIPWPWIIGTLVISVPATAFLTYKMTESMAKSKLGLKLFEKSTAAKRKKKRKR